MKFVLIYLLLQSSVPSNNFRQEWLPVVKAAASHYNLDWKLMDSMIRAESNWQSNAKSHAGAEGLAQIMPATQIELGVTNPYDPGHAIWGMALYLSKIRKQVSTDWDLIIASYNAGPNRVKRCMCIPNISETKQYVIKVNKFWKGNGNGLQK